MKYILAALLFASSAHAQIVVSCSSDWGSSGNCGGCNGLEFKTPSPSLKVKTTASDFWVRFDSLKGTDSVFTQSGKKDGDTVVCSQATPILVSQLGTTSAPPPAPTPTSPCNTNGCKIIWTAPTQNEDGTPIKAITTYLLNVNTQSQSVGNVLEYNLVRPAGDYTIYLQTVTADGTSKPTNAALVHVTAVSTPPPDPPPAPKPILTKIAATWTLKKGTSNVLAGLASEQACEDEIVKRATATLTTYYCAVSDKYTVKLP